MNNVPDTIHGDPWFQDGNIVLMTDGSLLAETVSRVAFKVHRGMLARHSEIFQSMFDIPQPGKQILFMYYTNPQSLKILPAVALGETLEGCPVVRMYDLPVELSCLIKALYDGAYVLDAPNASSSFEILFPF